MTLLRPVTVNLIESVFNGTEPSPVAKMAFGITSEAHQEALSAAILTGEVSAEQLDDAVSNGAKLSELVNRSEAYPFEVVFTPEWDNPAITAPVRETEPVIEPPEEERER
jgi:hypothetical protein